MTPPGCNPYITSTRLDVMNVSQEIDFVSLEASFVGPRKPEIDRYDSTIYYIILTYKPTSFSSFSHDEEFFSRMMFI